MAITTVTPVAESLLEVGDDLYFTVDDTYTTMLIEIDLDSALLVDAYDSTASGFQSGFEGSVVDNGDGTHTFRVRRPAGFDLTPFTIKVTEDEADPGGATTATTTTYYLEGEKTFPQGEKPYNGTADGVLAVLDEGVVSASTVAILDFFGFTVEKISDTRVKITDSGGGGAQHNFTAIIAPVVTDDSDSGYTASSIWYDTVTEELYHCVDATVGAAVWKKEGGGFHGFGEWEFDVTTAKADPTNGKFRLNNATQTSATEMYISQQDRSGAVLDNALNSLQSGDTIRLQSGSQGRVQVYTVNGTVVDEGVYKTVPIASVSEGSNPLDDTDKCSLYILRAVATSAQASIARVTFASGGGTPGTAEVTTNTTNWTAVATIKVHERDLDTNNIMTPWYDRLRVGDHIGLRERFPGGFSSSTVGNFLIDGIAYASNVYTFTVTPYPNNGGTPIAGDIYEVVLGFTKDSGGGTSAGMDQKAYVSGGGAPAAGKMTANADALSSVTTLNLSDSSGVDNNFSIAYGAIKAGDFIVLRDNAGGAAHGTFEVVSSVDNTTYWTFTVTFKNVSGSFVATNDYDIWVLSAGGAGDLVSAGTVAQDAALFTERPDHVNTFPDAGFHELWVRSDVTGSLMFTNDGGTDYVIPTIAGTPAAGDIPYVSDLTGKMIVNTAFGYSNASNFLYLTTAGGGLQLTEGATPTASPGANKGAYWVKNTSPTKAYFRDSSNADINLQGRTQVFTDNFGSYAANDLTNWIGPNQTDHYNYNHSAAYGAFTGLPTGIGAYSPLSVVAFDGTVTDVIGWYRPWSGTVDGDMHLFKVVWDDTLTTYTATDLGKICDADGTGLDSTKAKQFSTTLSASVSAGDTLVCMYKGVSTGTATYFRISIVVEES